MSRFTNFILNIQNLKIPLFLYVYISLYILQVVNYNGHILYISRDKIFDKLNPSIHN